MRDLKDLLEPLGERPMPDRWDSIQHRSVGPLPEQHRSRLGAGITAGVVAVLAIAVIVWISPLRDTGQQPESSTPPPPKQYVSPQGWTVTLPPGWTTSAFSIGQPGGAMQGTVISNQPVGDPVLNQFAIPIIPSDDFPSDAVALVVGDIPSPTSGGTQPVTPPLSYSDFTEVGTDGNAAVRIVSFEGPRELFFATTQTGSDASQADVDALRATIASLSFGDEAGITPSPSGAPGLPTQDAVVDNRFVSDVVLDDGAFSVQPAPVGTVPVVPKADAEKILLGSPVFQGVPDGVVGFGLVTSQVSQYGVPTYTADPAWIAFGWGGITNCPNITAPPSPADLPSGGYVAVALVEGAGGGDLSYEAKSDTCGTVTGPTVRPATYIGSVPWTANGQVTGSTIQITYTLPACGTLARYRADGNGEVDTLSVEAEVPDTPGLCSDPSPTTDVVQLSPQGGQTITTVRHGPTGVVRQAGF
jgi:hypothetical protein